MTALIIGSGSFSRRALELCTDEFFTICADGGYDNAVKYGIVPDIVVGDMDSVRIKPEIKSVVFPSEKDETDSEIAVEYAIKNGFTELILTGFTGTRLDHTLNNILLLKTISKNGVKAVIVDDNNEIYYINDEIKLKGKPGDFISIIPVEGDMEGVTAVNVKYPLNEETLYFGKGRGISNELLGDECRITVKSGSGIIIKARD